MADQQSGNYLDDLHYNDAVAQKLIMFTFCDGAMVITREMRIP
ncbi:hypothetical protein [Waltera sp.]